jgi:hypothetical protein
MAERARSKDGTRETDKVLGAEGEISQQGRTGGDVAREVGTRDELKRAYSRPAGSTGETKEQSRPDGND